MPSTESSAGVGQPGPTGVALGPTVGHGSSPGRAFSLVTGPPPSQGRRLLAFAPGVRQLDAGRRALGVQEVDDPGQPGDLLVGPQADVRVADPAVLGHPGRLDQHQPEAAEREAAEVHQVVVADDPVGDGVLAHRCDHETVTQREAAEGQGAQQGGCAHDRVPTRVTRQGLPT